MVTKDAPAAANYSRIKSASPPVCVTSGLVTSEDESQAQVPGCDQAGSGASVDMWNVTLVMVILTQSDTVIISY